MCPHFPIENTELSVLVLAGGKGRRMDGQDKGLIQYQQTTLIERVLEGIGPQVSSIFISANRNLDRYASLGYPVIRDTLEDFQGPLAGILSAMSSVTGKALLTLPCDGPFVAEDYVERMRATYNESDCDLAVAFDGQRLQPVYAFLPLTLRRGLELYLRQGERKVERWYRRHALKAVDFSDHGEMFTNFNKPEDLDGMN